MHIKDHLDVRHRPDICVCIPHIFESVFIEIQSKQSNIVIGTIHRSNTPPKADLSKFQNTLIIINAYHAHTNKNIIIIKNFNIDLLKFEIQNINQFKHR